MQLHERRENGFEVIFWNPRTGVAHVHAHRVARRFPIEANGSTGRRELARVGEQIREHLLHLRAIGAAGDVRIAGRMLECDGLRVQLWFDESARCLERLLNGDVRNLELQMPRLELGKVEHVVDEAQQVSLIRLNAEYIVPLHRR